MAPIADIKREVYVPYSREHGAPWLGVRYTGKGLQREETLGYEVASDWSEGHQVRTSDDNGRTWSEWRAVRMTWPEKDGFSKEECTSAWCYDPVSDRTVRFIFQRYLLGDGPEAIQRLWRTGQQTYFDHNLWQVSDRDALEWSEPQQLRYEEGPVLAPGVAPTEEYLHSNQMYGSYNAIATREGTIVYPAAGVPMEITDRGQKEIVSGVLCFIGKWNPVPGTYDWEVSERIYVPHRISGRGLMEPAIAELADGRLMLEMRGSTEAVENEWKGKKTEEPGRRWISLSKDGGHTWSDVTDLRYDTGEQFYSPSSLARLLRHSGTGKLYWFGNITPTPPRGNLPRYPLYMAEVDETTPALKKDTLTLIDDYDPEHDSPEVQLSNFCLLENRENGEIELYMTRLGERKKGHWLEASAYRYTITLL